MTFVGGFLREAWVDVPALDEDGHGELSILAYPWKDVDFRCVGKRNLHNHMRIDAGGVVLYLF